MTSTDPNAKPAEQPSESDTDLNRHQGPRRERPDYEGEPAPTTEPTTPPAPQPTPAPQPAPKPKP